MSPAKIEVDMPDNTLLSLRDIAEYESSHKFSLPSVQRNFVWRPFQIENFWDSLLRGYPVGSFVAERKKDENDNPDRTLELLDGQQRATSVCLGFLNPLVEDKTQKQTILGASGSLLRIFIDLQKPSGRDDRKYLFRVITKAHPWGFQRGDNQRILEASERQKALKAYGVKRNYLKSPIGKFWPWDAGLSLPLGLFLHARDPRCLEEMIDRWLEGKAVTLKNGNILRKFDDVKKLIKGTDKDTFYELNEIYEPVQRTLEHKFIPLLVLSDETLRGEKDNKSAEAQEGLDAAENLFIRLNSAGSPLSGEDLTYSLLKTKLDRETTDLMEKACAGLFRPARFLTLAYRLYQHRTGEGNVTNLALRPSQFTRFTHSPAFVKFKDWLDDILKKQKIQKVYDLLVYKPEENDYGLPVFVAAGLADSAPEIMFVLLYRLWLKKDKIIINPELHRNVLGVLTLLAWLGNAGGRSNHARLLRNIISYMASAETEEFWSSETIYRAARFVRGQEALCLPPRLRNRTLNFLRFTGRGNIAGWHFDNFANRNFRNNDENQYFDTFLYRIFYKRELLLYAQRKCLHLWFPNPDPYLLYELNRPFDYDHISPQAFIDGRRGIHKSLRSWYQSNGNLWALPLSWNRGLGATSAAEKLGCNQDTFDQNIIELGIKYEFEPNILYAWSLCNYQQWSQIDDDNLANNAGRLIAAIWNRNVDLCQRWYRDLLINRLIPNNWPAEDERFPEEQQQEEADE
jgi:hypothetical protein